MKYINPESLPRLLGARVVGLGTITAVTTSAFSPYALITDAAGGEHHRFLSQLTAGEVRLCKPQPYDTHTRRIGYGVWDEVHSLVPTRAATLEAVA